MDTRERSVKRQVHMLKKQSWEFSSMLQHDFSTHSVSQSVNMLQWQSQELSSTLQYDCFTQPAFQSVKQNIRLTEQNFQEYSSSLQCESTTQPAFRSPTYHVRPMERQSQEYSSMLQQDFPSRPASQSLKLPIHPMEYSSKHEYLSQWHFQEYSSTVQHSTSSHQASQQLQTQLEKYILDTFTYMRTVRDFCDTEPKWTSQREQEIKRMKDIKSHAEQLLGSFKSKKKKDKKLGAVLRDTLQGLEELQHFLDAIERLVVTSLFVFVNGIFLPKEVRAEDIRSVISTARTVSPLLIHFKRDAEAFFFPSLDNLDVLVFQLHKYMRTTQWICKKMKSKITDQIKNMQLKPLKLNLEMGESIVNLIVHLGQLSTIRMDELFRLAYLFHEDAEQFIKTYRERRSRMFQFLSDLEEAAVELDKMKMGSSISTVAGSSVGAVGGVMSIVGLALAPVTAGVSLGLTLTGVGLGVTSGVNGLVTGIAKYKVNKQQRKKANITFQNFMEDVQKILDCLEQAASSQRPAIDLDGSNEACGMKDLVRKVDKNVKALVDGAVTVKNATRIPLAISKTARVAGFATNALFIGFDIALICKESVSLAKKEESKVSQLIRSRSALWRSEIGSWEKICNSLHEEQFKFKEKLSTLDQKFDLNEIII